MFNIGAGELTLILVLALLILGPKKLPELARGLGKFVREFRRQTDEVRNVVEREFYRMDQDMDLPKALSVPPESSVEVTAKSSAYDDANHPAPVDESDPGHPDYDRQEALPAPDQPEAPKEKPS